MPLVFEAVDASSGALIVGGEESLRKLTRFEKTVHNRGLR